MVLWQKGPPRPSFRTKRKRRPCSLSSPSVFSAHSRLVSAFPGRGESVPRPETDEKAVTIAQARSLKAKARRGKNKKGRGEREKRESGKKEIGEEEEEEEEVKVS